VLPPPPALVIKQLDLILKKCVKKAAFVFNEQLVIFDDGFTNGSVKVVLVLKDRAWQMCPGVFIHF
jgi:hypothetical protein